MRRKNKNLVLGLTGSFGTGKTFVASIFMALGAVVIDADKLARKALKKNSVQYKKVVSAFGTKILDENRNIDRRALSKIVFGDRKKLKRLNKIVHPSVIRKIKGLIAAAKDKRVVIVDAPLLVEAGLANMVDRLIVVKASRQRQIERCQRKFKMTKSEIIKRIRSQAPLRYKMRIADFIINNNGNRKETEKEVREIWQRMSRITT